MSGNRASRFALSRRTMLRGMLGSAAVALALPPLEAMLNSNGTALANGDPLPRRFMTWFFGNGVRLEQWTPQGQGSGYELTDELAPLVNVKDYCSILSGFDNKAGYGRRGHHDGVAGFFSGHPFIEIDPMGALYASKFGGPSIDQVAASIVGSKTFMPSLHVGVSKRVTTGEGPTLLEAMTMRWHGHNEGEEAFAGDYRPVDEVDSWRTKDPIPALRARLLEWGTHDEATLDAIDAEETERIEAALKFAEASPFPDPEEALQHVFFDRQVHEMGEAR